MSENLQPDRKSMKGRRPLDNNEIKKEGKRCVSSFQARRS